MIPLSLLLSFVLFFVSGYLYYYFVSSAAQRIVCQNSHIIMLICTLQNASGCSFISLYFWHTIFDIGYYVLGYTLFFT